MIGTPVMETSPYRRRMTMTDILDGTFRLYRGGFVAYIGAVALTFIPFGIIQIIATFVLQQGLIDAALDPLDAPSFDFLALVSGSSLALIFIGLLQTIIIQPIVYGANVWTTNRVAHAEPISLLSAFDYGVGRMVQMVLFAILAMLAYILAIGISAGMLFGGAVGLSMGSSGGSSALLGFMIFVGLILLVVTFVIAILLVIRLLYAPQAIVLAEVGVFTAMRRSWELTDGLFWRTFGILFLLGLLLLVIQITLGGIAQFINLMLFGVNAFAPDPTNNNYALAQAIATMFGLIINIFIFPIYPIITTLLYYDTTARKEGSDIELRLEQQIADFPTS